MRDSHHRAGKAPNVQQQFWSPFNIKQYLQKVTQKGQSSTQVLRPSLAACSPLGAGQAVPQRAQQVWWGWGPVGFFAAGQEGGLSPASEIET